MRDSNVEAELAALEALPLAELRLAWVRQMKTRPPKVSAGLTRLALAHAIQCKAFGGVPKALERKLRDLAGGGRSKTRLVPGTRLTRSWNGKLHIVTVTEEQRFHWRDKDWSSLSEVAREITSTRWSGQAFFGLKPRKRAG